MSSQNTAPGHIDHDGMRVYTRVSDLMKPGDRRREPKWISPTAVPEWIPTIRWDNGRDVPTVVEVSGHLAKNGERPLNAGPYTSWVVVAGPDHQLVSEALIKTDGKFLAQTLGPLHAAFARAGAVEGAWYRLLYCPWFMKNGDGEPFIEVYFEPYNGRKVQALNDKLLHAPWTWLANTCRRLLGQSIVVPDGFIHDPWAGKPNLEREIAGMVVTRAGTVAKTLWNAWARDREFTSQLQDQGINLAVVGGTKMEPPVVANGRIQNAVLGRTVMYPEDD